MKKLTFKLTAMLGCLFVYDAHSCTQNPNFNNIRANIPNKTYTIQYDDLTSKDLETIWVNYGSAKNTYSENNNCVASNYLEAKYIGTWGTPDSSSRVATNIPGIYLRIQTAGIGFLNAKWNAGAGSGGGFGISATDWQVTVIKSGQVTQSNSITSGNVAQLTQYNPSPMNSTWYLSTLVMPANAIKVNVLSCSLKNSVPVINMGDWYDTQFKNIGDTSTDIDIPITLSCLQGTNIKATVTATSGVDNATQGQLALSGANKATGVAIQLVDKAGKPIPLGTKNTVQNNVSNGDYIFGWKARYIKTANSITPGPANATATVNIRYE